MLQPLDQPGISPICKYTKKKKLLNEKLKHICFELFHQMELDLLERAVTLNDTSCHGGACCS